MSVVALLDIVDGWVVAELARHTTSHPPLGYALVLETVPELPNSVAELFICVIIWRLWGRCGTMAAGSLLVASDVAGQWHCKHIVEEHRRSGL